MAVFTATCAAAIITASPEFCARMKMALALASCVAAMLTTVCAADVNGVTRRLTGFFGSLWTSFASVAIKIGLLLVLVLMLG